MKPLLAPVLFFLLFSCAVRPGRPDILIEGTARGLPDGMLYLAEARKWRTPLDSAMVRNGRFAFRLQADTSFVPYMAALYYWDKDDSSRPVRLQFRNHTLADSLTVLRDVFWLEPGSIRIEGDNNAPPWLRIQAGKETELLYRHQFGDIGWMGERDSMARTKKMDRLKSLLQENPSSYFLLQSISDSKEFYSKEELADLFAIFDKQLQLSAPGKQFSAYLSVRPDAGAPYPNLRFASADGNPYPIIDPGAKLNMLVFWASWCGPCIKEIPQLKEMHREFSTKGLNMVSISIDEHGADWQRALPVHAMPWRQLLIKKEMIEETEQLFNFTTIPFLLFTDRNGKELARFADYDPDNAAKYRAFILQYLH